MDNACDYHRVTLPMTFLKKQNDKDVFLVAFEGRDSLHGDHISDQDIVFFNRIPPFDLNSMIKLRSAHGMRFKLVMDIDDWWQLYPKHIEYGNWQKNKMEKNLIENMEKSDMIFTTNDRLAEKVDKYNQNVKVLPNALPYGATQFTDNKGQVDDIIKFIYAGGRSHYWDIKTIENVFIKSKGDLSIYSKSEYILGGFSMNDPYWAGVYNIMDKSGSVIKKARAPIMQYMNLYNGSHVSLCPLENNMFNSYKSNLKVLEAGCKKMPVIASNIWPYLQDEEMHGKGLILCNKTSDWIDAIRFFIKNPEKIKEYGNALYEYVSRKYNLHEVNELRYKHFKSIL